eukprot:TRINITY_DN7364_c0_g1_i1.p1 TRINITY_DN7364_c0_g1~~TRINITY_DN7364_c0_g1_i1.p1  ORF type:complete len:142 (-),score=34.53 TRINITY_DN7364_c0_g1_i1:27-452(-)
MIACVAVVGRGNNPLYIRSFSSQTDELKFHYIVHTALDIIEDAKTLKLKDGSSPECFLGLLYPTEDFKVYGYITNTFTKLIMVLDEYTDIKEQDICQFFEKFHHVFIDRAVCNPFYNDDDEIRLKGFELDLTKLVAMSPLN